MSCTEIYGFDRDGVARWRGEVRNSWRGAWHVWSTLEKKYLPSLPKRWSGDAEYVSRLNTNDASELWELNRGNRLEPYERILLLATMDYALVEAEKLSVFISVLEKWCEVYPGETNYDEQINMITLLMKEDVSAVGFNATSVNSDGSYCLAGEDEEIKGYNYKDNVCHYFVFEAFEQITGEKYDNN